MAWLLDTNILSELRRLKPEPKVLTFVAGHPLEELFISTVTLAELRFGIELLSDGSRREELSHWLSRKIRPMLQTPGSEAGTPSHPSSIRVSFLADASKNRMPSLRTPVLTHIKQRRGRCLWFTTSPAAGAWLC